MTTKDPAVRAAAAADFTMMYATHDAFRRDLGRLKAAATAGPARGQCLGELELLQRRGAQPIDGGRRIDREVDEAQRLFCLAPAGRAVGLALLAEMAAEHAQIDPLLAAVDDALAHSPSNLAAAVAGLASALEWHLKHEEDAALPLIQSVCTPADWRAFAGAMRRAQGIKGAAPLRSVDPRRHRT